VRRPRGFADLAGARVGIFGYGVEGRAARERVEGVAATIVVVDDDPRVEGVLRSDDGGREALAGCEVVLKSPGVPRRRDDVLALEAAGVVVTSALSLWLNDADRSRVVAVTGTKGKSTTTSVIAHLLAALGEPASVAGNIGRPPYEAGFDQSGFVVLEVSSFQAVDLESSPGTVVLTSLGADHLDWHGTLEQYHADKLRLASLPGDHVTFAADEPALRERSSLLGPTVNFVGADDGSLTATLGLIGKHNEANVGLARAVVGSLVGASDAKILDAVSSAEPFAPLPGRLTVIAHDGAVTYVDDGLATAPLPTIAALDVFADEPVAVILGGQDRGVDYTGLAGVIARRVAPTTIVVMPEAGSRIARTINEHRAIATVEAGSMHEAVTAAAGAVANGGVVLLSPAAPSFAQYQNWQERSADFAESVARYIARR
jgi:UDP-N-acetylmuramoylalanine--D-glutamate ligase